MKPLGTQLRRVALLVAYDGTDFHGWQRQPNGRTVQQDLESMLSRLAGDRPVVIAGAGRTDAGVHAQGQVAHADIPSEMDSARALHALPRMSPPDLGVLDLVDVEPGFHARFQAVSRRYCYTIFCRPNPFLSRYGWRIDRDLDIQSLDAAATRILGRRDFTPLSKHNPDTPNHVCNVQQSRWLQKTDRLVYEITADRFLYGMVRLVVGIQIDIALHRRLLSDLDLVLEATDRSMQSAAAPASGLSLAEVCYPSTIFQS